MWNGTFDDEVTNLCAQDMQNNGSGFMWHRYFKESTTEMAAKYRGFMEYCSSGPIVAKSSTLLMPIGTSELCEMEKADLKTITDLLLKIRRQTLSFVAMPAVGGAAGGDYTKPRLEKVWEGMRLGHKFSRKKQDVRAFVLSSDLFAPNVAKQSVSTSMCDQIPADVDRMRRVLYFIVQKRQKQDIILLFDGRSKSCRRVIEEFEEKMQASGAHPVQECWIVYVLPSKTEDPRIPGRHCNFVNNNKEMLYFATPHKKTNKVVQRAEFNACGELSTSATTYTGVPMRRYSELPRMEYDTKASILGATAAAAVKGKRAQKDIDRRGHPFSHCEVKPLNLWQRLCEHHQVTHIVDLSPGSAALAIAAAGALQYEGIATNEDHCHWLDSTLDRCIMYMAGKEQELVKKLGGDDEFMAKVGKYFAGTMMEARRMLEPMPLEINDNQSGDDSSEGSAA